MPVRLTGRRDDRLAGGRVRLESWLTIGAIALTLVAFGLFLFAFGTAAAANVRGPLGVLEALAFLAITLSLVYGGLVYNVARLGYMKRRRRFRHASLGELDEFRGHTNAQLTILVPSYKEEARIVRQTLLSAALQDYPNRRVVLLIDDPPTPSSTADREALQAARGLAAELQHLLEAAREPLRCALRAAEQRAAGGVLDPEQETGQLASHYSYAAAWFEGQADREVVENHSDALFVEMCLREQAARHAATAADLRHRVLEGGPYPDGSHLLRRYRHLDSLFAARLTGFERKLYSNLSDAPNKAMNLNTYIALMGRDVAAVRVDNGLQLACVVPQQAEFHVPDADYVLTLDADSLLEPSYAARLVRFLEQPENARVAVAQTPYSAVLGAPGSTERIAGASTDLQYVIHQGFTAHGATYWVGANAVLRKRALEDIATTVMDAQQRTHMRYIQDRTVIEDTESSIDLIARGWQLFNYPARLSCSATPPDFGALVVQRRRWANGGLLILPKLIRLMLKRRAPDAGALHGFMRVHYLVSIAAVNLGLIVLFLVPLGRWYMNGWLPLTALPYFALYAHDLRLAGYRRRDLVRVYALNLLLIPVNAGGVLRSLHQGITGRPSAFKRTPKVSGRTSAPAIYILAPCLLALFMLFGASWSVATGKPLEAVASGLNAALLVFAVGAFIGWRHGFRDVAAQLRLPRVLSAAAHALMASIWLLSAPVAAVTLVFTLAAGPLRVPALAAIALGATVIWIAGLSAGLA
jgi:cellulose synthase/poly-beta-1,6-N-acetylglucosamine synthase-like glycosyltransferase